MNRRAELLGYTREELTIHEFWPWIRHPAGCSEDS
jgi:hypothetical protein